MKKIFNLTFLLLLFGFTAFGQLEEGDTAPDFTVTDTHGEEHNLYSLLDAGKWVIVDFYYTTCIPCQTYTSHVNVTYENYGCNQGDIFFIGIDHNDDTAEVEAYDQQYGIQYPSVSGLDGGGNRVVSDYGILGFPTFYIIAPDRKIMKDVDTPTSVAFEYYLGQLGHEKRACSVSNQNDVLDEINIYPNPAAGNTLNVETGDIACDQFAIYSTVGKLIKKGDLSGNNSIDIADLRSGLYLITLMENEQALATMRFKKM